MSTPAPTATRAALLVAIGALGACAEPEIIGGPAGTLEFHGAVVDITDQGEVIRETALFHGQEYIWMGKLESSGGSPESPSQADDVPSLDEITLAELAEDLRGMAFYQGHRFLQAEPAWALAGRVKDIHALRQAGASLSELSALIPQVAPSQSVADTEQAEGGPEFRTVHGFDDRAVMSNTSYPHSTHIVFDNAGSAINGSEGSGSLIGSSTAMSVAHVFWDEDADDWEGTHRWAPGYDNQDADASPFGVWTGCYWVTIPQGYADHESKKYDYAVVDFNTPNCSGTNDGVDVDHPGDSTGWLGARVAPNSEIKDRTAYVRGYPGLGTCGNPARDCDVRVWGDTSASSENKTPTGDITIKHKADTSGGQSGSAIYHYVDGGAYLIGMHRAGGNTYNFARKYNSTVANFMSDHSDDY